MHTKDLIHDLIIAELKGLCVSCRHANTCTYRRNSNKDIIQCEMFESDYVPYETIDSLQGLCKTCDIASNCKLSGKTSGVWRCNDYR